MNPEVFPFWLMATWTLPSPAWSTKVVLSNPLSGFFFRPLVVSLYTCTDLQLKTQGGSLWCPRSLSEQHFLFNTLPESSGHLDFPNSQLHLNPGPTWVAPPCTVVRKFQARSPEDCRTHLTSQISETPVLCCLMSSSYNPLFQIFCLDFFKLFQAAGQIWSLLFWLG